MTETASTPGTDPADRWSALGVLAVAMLLGMTTWFSASAVVPQLRLAWGLDPGQAAGLTIGVQLGFVAGALVSAVASLADRYNPRHLMCYGAIGAAVVNIGLLLEPGITLAIALRVLTGFCLACVYPPAMKAMSTWFKRGRGTALGIMVGALTLGSALPNLVNGLGGADWRTVIIATSILSVLGGLTARFLGRDGPFTFPQARFDPGRACRAFAERPVLLASIGYFGHMWELYAMWAWFGAFFAHNMAVQRVAYANGWGALAAFAVIGIGAVGCWWGGRAGDRIGRAQTTSLAMSVSAACALVIGWLPGNLWPLILAIGLVWGFFVVADSAQFSTAITELGDQRYIGSALTLQLAIGFVLTVPTIWLIPLIETQYGWGPAFALLAVGPILGTIAMQCLRPIEQRYRSRPL